MTLGERIAQRRKVLGISQEELGARLGVSRQAVSKWETGTATPDMRNLLALAKEFSLSVAELTQTPEAALSPAPPQGTFPEQPQTAAPAQTRQTRNWPRVLLLCLLFAALAGALFWAPWSARVGQADSNPASPAPAPATEFALLWTNSAGEPEFLELGTQEDFFPFGASLTLTAPEEVVNSDFRILTAHRADCGALLVEYRHIQETPETPEQEVLTALSTMVTGYATPRGITPSSSEAELLAAYGDELVYCLKEEGGCTLVPHEYYYAWSDFADGYCAIFFYIRRGQVAGIRTEMLGELGNFYEPDNVFRFPVKNGEPDFSLRQEPERESLSDTQRVYIAFNQLVTNNNLTAEERYACRRDIFGLLPDLDWTELGQMGTAEYPGDTILALMDYLKSQDAYTESEILWIQLGCTAKGLDGAYTDSYCGLLARAFFCDPVVFVRNLAADGIPEQARLLVIRFTAYDAEWHPEELETSLEVLDEALDSGQLQETEAGWARLLRLYLTTPVEERNKLPALPEDGR